MSYTEQSVATQNVMSNKGILFLESGLINFIQVGEPIQKEDRLTFARKLVECGDTFCPECATKLVKNGALVSTLKHSLLVESTPRSEYPMHVFAVSTLIADSTPEASLFFLKPTATVLPSFYKEYTENLLSELRLYSECSSLDHWLGNPQSSSVVIIYNRWQDTHMPERQEKYLAIDELKLHDGYNGKKKAVVYEFMDHAGDEWVSKVKVVACDMNSDFEEAFKERYPKLDIVYDRFHIIKNFNDKVVSEIRKDKQKWLADEGSP